MGKHIAVMSRRPRTLLAMLIAGLASTAMIIWLSISIITSAAWSDTAFVNSAALGGENRFDIALWENPVVAGDKIVDGGTVRQGSDHGVTVEVPGASTLVPGRTISATVGVFNNSPALSGEIVPVVEQHDTSAVDITDYLVFTIVDAVTGETIVDAKYLDEVADAVRPFTLAPRDRHSFLEEGDAFAVGAVDAARVFEISIYYATEARDGSSDTERLNGGRAHVRVGFAAVSG